MRRRIIILMIIIIIHIIVIKGWMVGAHGRWMRSRRGSGRGWRVFVFICVASSV